MAGNVGTAPGTTTITMPGGITVALGDWIDDRNYGAAQFNNGDTSSLTVFSSGRGQPVPGGTRMQTLIDTNVQASGITGLPKSWEFLVYGLAIEFTRVERPVTAGGPILLDSFSNPIRVATFFEGNRRIFCRYVYNGKMYSEGLIVDYPQGHGMSIFTTQPNTEVVNNGVPSPRDRTAMVLPIWERELLSYGMELTPIIALVIAQPASDGHDDLTSFDIRVTKNGLIKRQVV